MVLYKKEIDSPVGTLTVVCNNDTIINLSFGKDNSEPFFTRYFPDAEFSEENALCQNCAVQLAQYFFGERKTFDLPVQLNGTPYQKNIWNALLKIPYGKTTSYAGIATLAGTGSARSAGGALGQNPVAIVVPCHRVIAANGGLGGFCKGFSLTGIKQKLLMLERSAINP